MARIWQAEPARGFRRPSQVKAFLRDRAGDPRLLALINVRHPEVTVTAEG